jgi:hypothetical protein
MKLISVSSGPEMLRAPIIIKRVMSGGLLTNTDLPLANSGRNNIYIPEQLTSTALLRESQESHL